MKYLSGIFIFINIICSNIFGQINTPAGATIPFGSLIASDPTPYPFGLIAGNLPAGAYTPASNLYGKSQDAYTAYNSWKTCYAQNCTDSWRIKFDNSANTVSEGIAYGMLLSAYAADKALFDGLWAYYKLNTVAGLGAVMGWHRNGCADGRQNAGDAGQDNGATDAELDAALALLVAECQWPAINSPYDYAAEATFLIGEIRVWEIQPAANPPQYQANNGDGWGFGSTCRNPSYQSPAYYKLFQPYDGGAPAGFWNNCVTASYTLINNNNNNTTGLISNWSDQNGTPNGCNGPNEYGFDACRNPWRMATDYLWNGDANALGVTNLMTDWMKPTAATNVRGPLAQNAANPSLGSWHNALFVSTYGLAVMANDPAAADNAANQTYLNNMYTETVAITETQSCSGNPSGYFGNTLRVVALFMQTGNFWEPCPTIAPVNLLNFNASEKSGKVYLQWATASEENNDYFILERSSDGENFEAIEKVKGNGNSNTIIQYSAIDEFSLNGTSYYRLAQYDEDGKINYSDVISITKEETFYVHLAPNPFNDELKISLSGIGKIQGVLIKDLTGKVVFESSAEGVNLNINLNTLSKGLYIIQVTLDTGIHRAKLLKN